MKKLACLVLAISLCECSPALAQPNFQKLATAIHKAENGSHNLGESYGIHSVSYKNEAEARRICLRTIKHKFSIWNGQGNFLAYLSKKYCPKNSTVWLKNVAFFYGRAF